MSVRLRKWTNKAGKVLERWTIDVKVALPGQRPRRIRDFSPVNTPRGAEQYERQVREALLAGTLGKEVKEVPTLDAFQARFLDYAEVNNKPSTVYAKRWVLREHLVPAFGKRRLDEIGPADVEAYKARKLKDGQAAKSVNNHLCVLRKLLNLAVEWGELSHAPRVKQLRVAHGDFQFLTFDETPRFVRAAAPEWRAFVTIALKTGLRVGELLALRWEDLDLVAGRLVVRRTLWRDQEGTPKGGRMREVPLSDEAIAVLKAHKHLRGPYVFCEVDGARLTHSRVKDVVPRACARAGLAKRLTTHDLRHSFASHLVMRGVALKGGAGAPGARHDGHDDAVRASVAGGEEGGGEGARPAGAEPAVRLRPASRAYAHREREGGAGARALTHRVGHTWGTRGAGKEKPPGGSGG